MGVGGGNWEERNRKRSRSWKTGRAVQKHKCVRSYMCVHTHAHANTIERDRQVGREGHDVRHMGQHFTSPIRTHCPSVGVCTFCSHMYIILQISMRHVTNMSDVWVTYEWRMSDVWVTCEWRMSDVWVTCEWRMSDVWVTYEWRMSESCHVRMIDSSANDWLMCEWLIHVRLGNPALHSDPWLNSWYQKYQFHAFWSYVISHIYMSHGSWGIFHIWISACGIFLAICMFVRPRLVTHINESCQTWERHTCKWGVSHV